MVALFAMSRGYCPPIISSACLAWEDLLEGTGCTGDSSHSRLARGEFPG